MINIDAVEEMPKQANWEGVHGIQGTRSIAIRDRPV